MAETTSEGTAARAHAAGVEAGVVLERLRARQPLHITVPVEPAEDENG
jgi:hypothetical protein